MMMAMVQLHFICCGDDDDDDDDIDDDYDDDYDGDDDDYEQKGAGSITPLFL